MTVFFEVNNSLIHFRANRPLGLLKLFKWSHKLFGGINRQHRVLINLMTRERVKTSNPLNFIPKKFQPNRLLIKIGGTDFDDIPSHSKSPALKGDVVSLIKHIHKLRQNAFATNLLADLHREKHFKIVLRRRQSVDARDASDDNHIGAREQGGSRRKSQTLNLLVDRRVLFDVSVAPWNICFWLVIIEVAHKVLHRIMRKELPKLGVKLRRQSLIVRHHQCRFTDISEDIGRRKCLP